MTRSGTPVTTYQPKAWQTRHFPATATAITQLMTEVVRAGTAKAVGFPAAEDVAAKTGTAQVRTGRTHRRRTG